MLTNQEQTTNFDARQNDCAFHPDAQPRAHPKSANNRLNATETAQRDHSTTLNGVARDGELRVAPFQLMRRLPEKNELFCEQV